MKQLNAKEWKEQLESTENAVMVDVRTPEEWAEKVISENAEFINIHDQQAFIDWAATLDKTKHYMVYCRSGMRSGNACAYLNSIGIENTYNLVGGIINWPYETAVMP